MLVPVVITITITIAVVLVVFISPVAFRMPTPGIGVPPLVIATPTMFAGFCEVVTGAVGLATAIAVVLNSLVKPAISSINASLTVIIISAQAGGCA
jgi:hypothetical protein